MKLIKKKKDKYIHDEVTHNMNAPSIIVPMILDLLPATRSVVDFGCGLGTWLKAFKNNGVAEIFGMDGDWYNKKLLFKYINEDEFKCVDLEQPITLDKMYDLVISLEVAEHLSEKSSDIFIQSLVNAGKIILFSAAITGQGGYKHVNEQLPSYWVEKFRKHGYKSYDIIRRRIWDIPNIEPWYKQNTFLVAHNTVSIDCNELEIMPLVHPDIFKEIYKILQGKRGISLYLRLLFKSIINKFTK